MKNIIRLTLILLTSFAFYACSDPDDADGADGDGSRAPVYRTIGGTTAIGLPGKWANNCLNEACGLSNEDGVYRLRAIVDRSSLMRSTIPMPDGSSIVLHSRYRHDAELTSAMVNFNPTTQAMLEVWSLYSQGTPLDECYAVATCASALMTSFTAVQEDTLVNQWATLLEERWPEGRNPFSDLYRADPNPNSLDYDPLDHLHDHIRYDIDREEEALRVLNNNDEELARVPFRYLVLALNDLPVPILATDLDAAFRIAPAPLPTGNNITVRYSVNPSFANNPEPPVTMTVNASNSSSVPAVESLIFSHQLTLANGDSQYFTGAIVSTTVSQPGTHFWAITVADGLGNSKTEGFRFRLGIDETPENPTFGADGSCYTPAPLTANSQNICEETLDGSETTACRPFQSGSINLVYSPLFCPREVQNEGALFGTCTLLASETKVFFYENPARFNTIDTFETKQQRTASQCTDGLRGVWSNTP